MAEYSKDVWTVIETNPDQLAKALGVSGVKLRQFLRDKFPRPASQKNKPWEITLEMVIAATRHFK